uniref:Terminal uridylyl transferase 1, U6 snRNA-specific n=1 Tax=Podarcis muralis TaxID=64176 RepID=A0A670JVS8_PODMU
MADSGLGDVESLPRGGFRCRLCHVAVANKPSLDDHLRGKKHQRLENLRTVRQAQELRSVFVSGFRKGTPASELSDYFQAYGEVANVVMDKDKYWHRPQHSLGGQKLRVKPREKKDFKYTPPRKQGSARQGQLSPEKLAQKVDAQMSLMVQLFEFSESERRLRDLLVTLFQEVFLEFFPGSAVLPFGSSVNGFNVSGCDLDLFLDLEKTKNFQASAKRPSGDLKPRRDAASQSSQHWARQRNTLTQDKNSLFQMHLLLQAEDGASVELDSCSEDSILSDIDLASATVPEVLELVAAVMRKCVPGVHNVQAVLTARRPVVKFWHKESGLRGDISINNKLAICNTRFLQLCTEMDERVRPLVYVVRYWAKQQALAGPLLNNYALTLLVLFFLQTRTPPILPTVSVLTLLCSLVEEEHTVVDGWDCSFPKDSARLEPSGNKEDLCSLLSEFFRVFEDYDFAGCVISLWEGRPLPLPSFLSSSEAGSKLKLGPFNLQDPFEQSHNVAANVNEKTALRFQHCCCNAAKYCRSLQYQRKSSKGKIWGLVRLFQPGATELLGQAGDFHLLWFQKVCASVAFVLRDMLKCSCVEVGQGLGEEQEVSEVKQEEEELEAKTQQLSVGSKRPLDEGGSNVSLPESMTWNCAVWHRVWLGRRRIRRQLQGPEPETQQQKANSLELEAKVSEAISQQECEARPTDPLFQFTVCAQASRSGTSREQDTRISLRFSTDPEQASVFQEFFHFLQGFLPRMVEQHLVSKA